MAKVPEGNHFLRKLSHVEKVELHSLHSLHTRKESYILQKCTLCNKCTLSKPLGIFLVCTWNQFPSLFYEGYGILIQASEFRRLILVPFLTRGLSTQASLTLYTRISFLPFYFDKLRLNYKKEGETFEMFSCAEGYRHNVQAKDLINFKSLGRLENTSIYPRSITAI